MQETTTPAPYHGALANRGARAFGGPWGALAMMVFMPAVSVYLFLCVHARGGDLAAPSTALLGEFPKPTLRACVYFTTWIVFQFALQLALPGKRRVGLPQPDGRRLEYVLNGLPSLGLSLGALGLVFFTGVVPLSAIWDELGPLLTLSVAFTLALSAFLYFYGRRSPYAESRTGDPVHDFFLGTALNPRIGAFDLKFFFESKIGMTTWIAVTLSMLAAQIDRHGTVGASMALVCAFQLLYVVDFYVFEDAMLSTWDINHENFGYMLAFGFLVWMPFNFSLQAEYLVDHDPALSPLALVLLTLLNLGGYVVFRSSNLQKHRFRTDPQALIWGKKPEFIATARGPKLLVSGFWGLSRHANYLGDFVMASAWCLTTGFSHLVPYFYVLYFAPLLVHRERRDHEACQEKYGADWDEYCRRVPYRIVPRLY